VTSQQQAKAWFNFSLGGSFNTSLSWGGLKSCWASEPWPTNAYGAPQYSWYGPSNSGPPSYPVNPYGMSTYGAGGPQNFTPPPPRPAPQGSGSPTGYNYAPPPVGAGYATPYYGNLALVQPAVYQPATQAAVPYYWNKR
jgi:hypothetical protein